MREKNFYENCEPIVALGKWFARHARKHMILVLLLLKYNQSQYKTAFMVCNQQN